MSAPVFTTSMVFRNQLKFFSSVEFQRIVYNGGTTANDEYKEIYCLPFRKLLHPMHLALDVAFVCT